MDLLEESQGGDIELVILIQAVTKDIIDESCTIGVIKDLVFAD